MNWLSFKWRLLPGILAALSIALLLQLGAFQSIEQVVYRSLFRLRGEQAWNDRIVLVAIDDGSLRQLGRFPIARSRYADLLNFLAAADPSVVAIDLIWSEPSGDDAALAEAMANYGRVVLAETEDAIGLPLLPVPQLRNAAIATGHIRKLQDSDGLVRRVEPQFKNQPALWLATLQTYSLVQAEVPLPTQPQVWLNWPGFTKQLQHYGLADVLSGKIPPAQFQDKIVLVGVTATALDSQTTPYDLTPPTGGTIVQAAALHNALAQNFLQPIDAHGWILLLGGPILGWILPRWSSRRLLLATVSVSLGWSLLSFMLFRANYWLPIAMPLVLFHATAIAMALSERLREDALLSQQVDRLWQAYQPDLIARDALHPLLRSRMPRSTTHRTRVAQLTALADQLGRSQSAQAAIARSLSIGLVAADNDGRVWFCNPTAIDWLEVEINSTLAAKLVPHWLSQSEWDSDFARLQIDRTPISRSLRYYDRWFAIILEPLIYSTIATSQPLDGFLLLIEDISDRKAAELQLQQAKDAAVAGSRAKGEFLANMSHELRTPLNAILGFTQLMLMDKAVPTDQREYLDIINSSGQHLLALINDVLEMSKIEAGGLKLNEASFDLVELLDRLEATFRLKAQSKQLQLRFELASNLPRYITADEGKLRQILINLVGNAIKFTSSGQVVLCAEITAESSKPDPNNLYTLHFTIADTGSGIAPEEIDRLFEPFIQTRSGQQAQEGTGLGLAITQRFVQLMGGKISVRSTLGRGSVFEFTILARSASIDALQPPDQVRSRQIVGLATNQSSYRVLIAEDQAQNRQYLADLLKTIGFEVRQAENGEEAIALWQHWQPHLILMDMRMPQISGYEATRQIKASVQGQAPIVIAVSGDVFEDDQAAMRAAGCDDVVQKPVQTEVLLTKLAQYLGVDYKYESSSDRMSIAPTESMQRELAAMPADWRAQLHEAAQGCSDRQVLELIKQIPVEKAALAEGLAAFAADYRFSDILDLIIATAQP